MIIKIFSALSFLAAASNALDTSDVAAARVAVATLINNNNGLGAKFLRLAFHDAVGGGNDGKFACLA